MNENLNTSPRKPHRSLPLPLLAALALAFTAPLASSQVATGAAAPVIASPNSRAQVKMDRDEFLRTHHWDPISDVWSLNSGVEPPTGVMSRADVKAARDTYLSTHRWDDARGWRPLASAPRNMSSLSREQVKAETRQFMRTHRWDESTEEWVLKPVAMKSR